MNLKNQEFNGDNLSSNLILNLDNLDDRSMYINWEVNERNNLFESLLKKITLSQFSRLINHDQTVLSDIKNGKVKPSGHVYFSILEYLGLKKDLFSLVISSRNYDTITLNSKYINPELIGLIHSDGLLRRYPDGSVHFCFTNQEKYLIDRFCELICFTFNSKISLRLDKRDGTISAYPQSIVGRIIANKIGWKTNLYPIPIFNLSEIPLYIRGLFDGDGTIYLYNKKTLIPTVRITFQHLIHAEQIKNMLLNVGIYSRICQEKGSKSIWYNIVITRQGDFLKFIDIIGSSHPKKKKRMIKIKKLLIERSCSLTPRI